MAPSAAHRTLNLLQSALLVGAMAALGWVIVSAVAGTLATALIVAGAVAGLLLAPALSRGMLLSAYGVRPLSAREFPQGVAMLAELARRAGLPRAPVLAYVPSRMPNAFAVGTPGDSVICVSDGLLRLLDRREFAGVLAHEVSHVAHLDLPIMGMADAMARAVSLASWIGQVLLLVNLPLLLVGAAHVPWHVPVLLIVSPGIMALLQLALSRMREYDADLGAARLTGDPEGLASALLKLERRTGRMWEEMILPGRRIPEPSLLRTHPPTEERIRRLMALAPRRAAPAERLRLPEMPVPPAPRFGRYGIYR